MNASGNESPARHPPAPGLLKSMRGNVMRERGDFTWVYIWGAPLRAMHWIAAFCIIALVVTGLYIGRPYFASSGEASAHFMMGRFRFIHFAAAAVIVMTGIVRIYWLWAGNEFERFSALFPITMKNMKQTFVVMKTYMNFRSEDAPNFIGHHPLQQWSYTGVYLMMAVEVITGFTLYGQSAPTGFIYHATAFIPAIFGGLQIVRLVHHAITWAFVIFVLMHIYLAVRSDYVERAGVVSSIITGGRTVPSDHTFEDFDMTKGKARQWPHQ